MHKKEMRQKKSEESLLPSLGHLYKLMLIIANDCPKKIKNIKMNSDYNSKRMLNCFLGACISENELQYRRQQLTTDITWILQCALI